LFLTHVFRSENGKLGSTAYVADLSEKEIADTACYINLDMIGSKNFVRFVLDGDSSNSQHAPLPPKGAPMAHIEQTLHDYFNEAGLAFEEAPLSNSYGYTDHTAFFDAGIPVSGLSTGVGSPKTASQALIFGGEAGEDWDACYHQSCDTIDNVNITLIKDMTRAVAHVLAIYGSEQGELFVFDENNAASQEAVPNNQQQLQTYPSTPLRTDPPTLPQTDPPTPEPAPEVAKDPYWPGPFPDSTGSININIMTDRFPEETRWEWSKLTGPTSWITLDEGVPSKSNSVNTQNQGVMPGELYR
jgi:Peptidase family M28